MTHLAAFHIGPALQCDEMQGNGVTHDATEICPPPSFCLSLASRGFPGLPWMVVPKVGAKLNPP